MKTNRLTRAQSGSAMVVTLGLVIAIMLLTIAGLSAAASNLKVSRNFRTGLQAMLAAEAGAVDAQESISDWGVIRFHTDIIPIWTQVFGTGWRNMAGYPGVRYSATIAADPDDPLGHAILTTTGQAPNEATRTVVSRLKIALFFSPGAIYLPGQEIDATFNGNRFLIDGHDTKLNGAHNATGDVPGITTRSEETKKDVKDSLSTGQYNNVIGDGGSPSVEMSVGPTAERIQNEIVPGVLAQPGVVTDPVIRGNDVFGTVQAPQITHFTGDLTISTENGTVRGAGILVVDGGLRISGNMQFTGMIIVRGTTEITTVAGNATVLGAIWTTDLRLTVQGSASVTYSTEALALAGGLGNGQLLPQRAEAVAWKES